MRMSRDEMLLGMAFLASYRGTCNRLQVGAVLAFQNRPVSVGYNGAPSGVPHCDSKCNPNNPCTNTIHAEINVIEWARAFGISPRGATLYITDSPCGNCAARIIEEGISRVVYNREYRVPIGLYRLQESGVEVKQCSIENVPLANCLSSQTTHAYRV